MYFLPSAGCHTRFTRVSALKGEEERCGAGTSTGLRSSTAPPLSPASAHISMNGVKEKAGGISAQPRLKNAAAGEE